MDAVVPSHLQASSPDSSAGTRIDLDDLAKRYVVGDTTVTALADVNLHVDETAFVVVLGPSGCGKTTLLNMIGLLDAPTEGRVALNGQDMTRASRREQFALRRRTVSFIFQTFNLFPGLTASRTCSSARTWPGDRGRPRWRRTCWRRSGWPTGMHHFPHQLSGGEQQRVAIARALATGNPIFLADEPTGELDFRTGVQILELLQQQAEAGKTVLVVTHNREISRVADRVIELSSGRIV